MDKSIFNTQEYRFLREDEHLGKNIILLGLGGSYAYGTNISTPDHESDIDLRGIATNRKEEILLGSDFEQVTNTDLDVTIYSFNKMIRLLTNCNPNTIELLGNKPENYIYISPIGKELINNAHMFLSKKAIYTFGGYANNQLYRLSQKSTYKMNHDELEKHILKTLEFMQQDFKTRYTPFEQDYLNLYIDKSKQPEYDTEIFMDAHLTHYPLRDYCSMWNDLKNTVSQYGKVGKRNKNAVKHGKIAKHMMHLIRLYFMCIDILEKEQIITYREKEHDLLMDIRNGKYLDEHDQPILEFMEIVNEYQNKLSYAAKHTNLPDEPNYKEINNFVMSVNEQIVKQS